MCQFNTLGVLENTFGVLNDTCWSVKKHLCSVHGHLWRVVIHLNGVKEHPISLVWVFLHTLCGVIVALRHRHYAVVFKHNKIGKNNYKNCTKINSVCVCVCLLTMPATFWLTNNVKYKMLHTYKNRINGLRICNVTKPTSMLIALFVVPKIHLSAVVYLD